jgi:hypothetical protein
MTYCFKFGQTLASALFIWYNNYMNKIQKSRKSKNSKKSRFIKVYLPLILALLVFVYLGYILIVRASDTATITVGSVTINSGTAGNLPVNFITGPIGVSAISFDISLPSPMIYSSTSIGNASLNAGKMIQSNIQTSGKLRVLIFGLNQTEINTGTIANISYSIPSNTSSGLIPILIDNVIMSDPNANNVVGLGVGGTILINGPTPIPTPIPTPTPTPVVTPTPTPFATPTPTPTPIITPTPTPVRTPTPTPPLTPTPTPSLTPTPTPSVQPITTGALSCTPTFQSASINQTVTFVANGGTGNYTWSTNSSAIPNSGSNRTFSTQFTTGGFKIVVVKSSDGQSCGCTVSVAY